MRRRSGPDTVVIRDIDDSGWLVFENPTEMLLAERAADVLPALRAAENRVNETGCWAAGFVSYEAAPGFDAVMRTHEPGGTPLVCLGLFDGFSQIASPRIADDSGFDLPRWELSEAVASYRGRIAAIRRQIELGNTYQINYTIRQRSDDAIDPWQLFGVIAGDARHAAYVGCRDLAVVSASPELFFRLNGEELTCRPMKGTAPRGLTCAQDLSLRDELRRSAKNRAENTMITDMIRNDLGRIAIPGSVRADSMLDIEKHRTVWQMTSTVTARTNATVTDILRALFPCASVTGAPKVASMRIIADLEDTPRGVYTGAIGYFGPGRQAAFNVAIRTATVDRRTGHAVYGIGGGIVWDSDADAEYRECLDKARILVARYPRTSEFELFETLLWTPDDGFALLDRHLARMTASAAYFDFTCDRQSIEAALFELECELPREPHRVRVLLAPDGSLRTTPAKLSAADTAHPTQIALAQQPIDRNDPFLYHKTTHRSVYARAMAAAGAADDVLLWNEDGEITETTIANVVVRIDGVWVTPPVECGLLAGTYREQLLQAGEIRERRIRVADLGADAEILLVNSVRGTWPGRLARA